MSIPKALERCYNIDISNMASAIPQRMSGLHVFSRFRLAFLHVQVFLPKNIALKTKEKPMKFQSRVLESSQLNTECLA